MVSVLQTLYVTEINTYTHTDGFFFFLKKAKVKCFAIHIYIIDNCRTSEQTSDPVWDLFFFFLLTEHHN